MYNRRYDSSKLKEFNKLLSNEFLLNYSQICNACISLIGIFQSLHKKGHVYHSIPLENIFIDIETGHIQICNDEYIIGKEIKTECTSIPKAIISPEVMSGEMPPDNASDLFILAVLLFQILFLEHPQYGTEWEEIAYWDCREKKRLFRNEAKFEFKQGNFIDRLNSAEDKVNVWCMYPEYIMDKFTQVFSDGFVHRGVERLSEEEWLNIFRRLENSIHKCPECGNEMIYDLQRNHFLVMGLCIEELNTSLISCLGTKCTMGRDAFISCRGWDINSSEIPKWIARIETEDRRSFVNLHVSNKVYTYQLAQANLCFDKGYTVAGEIVRVKVGDHERIGIENLTNDNWSQIHSYGADEIHPGDAMVSTFYNEITGNFGHGLVKINFVRESERCFGGFKNEW